MTSCKNNKQDRWKSVMNVSSSSWSVEEVDMVWKSRVGQEKLRDQDHIAVVIYSFPTAPGQPEFMGGKSGINPAEDMADASKLLEKAGCSNLCVICSTAHYFKEPMLKNVGIPFLDMIELTFDVILRQTGSDESRLVVGLLGTAPLLEYEIYEKACSKLVASKEIQILTPNKVPGGNQDSFTEAIFGAKGIKAGFDSDLSCEHTFRNFKLLYEQVALLQEQGAKHIILGCTE